MTMAEMEKRLEALELQVSQLTRRRRIAQTEKPWWRELRGAWAGDPIFEEAMKMGREYRQSLRPKARGKKSS
jgi:hypothetical protein